MSIVWTTNIWGLFEIAVNIPSVITKSLPANHKMNQAKKQCLGFKKLTLGKMDSHCEHAELMLD